MKIKPFFIIFLFACFVITNCYSQEFKLEDLKVPSSPAFILIGVTPKTIESPETPAGLGLTILNNFKGDLIPNNYSLEINPFWLFKKAPISFKEFRFESEEIGTSIVNNFSMSVATTKLDSPQVGTKLGFGIRTIFAPGTLKHKTEIDKAYTRLSMVKFFKSYIVNTNSNIEDNNELDLKNRDEYKKYLIDNVKYDSENTDLGFLDATKKEQNKLISSIVSKIKNRIVELDTLFNKDTTLNKGSDIDKLKNFKKYILDNSYDQTEYDDAVKNLGKVISAEKTGLQIEFAGAFSSNFLNDSIQNGKLGKIGVWLTAKEFLPHFIPGYESFVLMTRHISEKQIDSTWNSDDDLGLKYENDFGIKELSVSLEVVHRWKLRETSTYRAAINLEYKISDNNYITTTFGKDFDGTPLKPKGNLITLFGIKFGLGQTPKVDIAKK